MTDPNTPPLDEILRKGQRSASIRALVYGERGVGLTTLLAGAPDVAFLSLDETTNQRHELPQWQPDIETLADLERAIDMLAASRQVGDVGVRTLAIEGLEEIETMLVGRVEEWLVSRAEDTDGPTTLAEYNEEERGGGYELVREEWRKFLSRLDRVRRQTGIHIVMSCGLQREPVLREDGVVYDRWKPSITGQKSASLLKRWFDYVMHLAAEEIVDETVKPPKRTSGRFLYCTQTPWHDCKCHGGVEWPDRIACDRVSGWKTFSDVARLIAEHGELLVPHLRGRLETTLQRIGPIGTRSADDRRSMMRVVFEEAISARDYLRALRMIEYVDERVEP